MENIVAIVSGFSGVGKGTVVRRMIEKYGNYWVSVSMTTRNPRPGEKEDVDYLYRTQEEFDELVEQDGFLEHARFVGRSYGTPKKPVQEHLNNGQDVILEIEMQGAMQIKEKYPEVPTIFICARSRDEIRRRLENRKTETAEEITKRLNRAAEEVLELDNYEYILINDEVEACADQLHALIQAEKSRYAYKKEFVEKLKEDFRK